MSVCDAACMAAWQYFVMLRALCAPALVLRCSWALLGLLRSGGQRREECAMRGEERLYLLDRRYTSAQVSSPRRDNLLAWLRILLLPRDLRAVH